MRPLAASRPPSSRASLIRSSLERLISISWLQRSSGILAIVRSRVTPALWTTTSTPPAKRSAIRSGASGAVMSSSIASPPTLAATWRRSSPAWGTSRPTTSAPSAASVSAIAAPIPREAPVTSATLPASGRSHSISGSGATPSPTSHHLAGDVGGARREQEAQRRLELPLAAAADEDELRGRAASADLLAERADEALEGALRRGGAGRACLLRRRAEDDDAAVAGEPADAGVEEALQLDQLG